MSQNGIPIVEQYHFLPDHTVPETQLLPITLATRDIYDRLTSKAPESYRQKLASQVKYSPRGVPYFISKGQDYSRKSAVCTKAPFANRILPREGDRFSWNLIIKTDFE